MEIEYIREFVKLTETKNFAETAEQLFTTQSTISKHLKKIETELGVQLFNRTSRQVELNKFGQLFLPYAKKILQMQYEYTTAFYNEIGELQEHLTIGSIPVMAQYNITDIIARFKQKNVNFSLTVIEAESNDLKEILRQDKCELAFIRETEIKTEEFAKIHYMDDTLVAVLPISHPFAQNKVLALKDLKNENFLLLEFHTMIYKLCINACYNAGFNPNITYNGHRIENIVDLVSKKMGISLLMKKQAEYQKTSDICLIPIIPDITTHINLYYKKSKKLSIAAKHFLRCMQIKE